MTELVRRFSASRDQRFRQLLTHEEIRPNPSSASHRSLAVLKIVVLFVAECGRMALTDDVD